MTHVFGRTENSNCFKPKVGEKQGPVSSFGFEGNIQSLMYILLYRNPKPL